MNPNSLVSRCCVQSPQGVFDPCDLRLVTHIKGPNKLEAAILVGEDVQQALVVTCPELGLLVRHAEQIGVQLEPLQDAIGSTIKYHKTVVLTT